MLEVVLAGVLTGLAIAVPVGAVAVLLVTLSARSSLRTGAAAALGVATVDGAYAAAAVVGGAALAAQLAPVAGVLRLLAGGVLLALAVVTALHAVRRGARDATVPAPPGPGRAFAMMLAVTALNPATLVYFAAVVLGNRELTSTPAQGVVFVLAAFVGSAAWQLLLAAAGAGLGRAITGRRGQLVTGVVSAVVIAALAVRTMLG